MENELLNLFKRHPLLVLSLFFFQPYSFPRALKYVAVQVLLKQKV